MDSIAKTRLRRRIADIVDMAFASQAGSKELNEHLKGLRKAAGEKVAGDINDLIRDTGGGL